MLHIRHSNPEPELGSKLSSYEVTLNQHAWVINR